MAIAYHTKRFLLDSVDQLRATYRKSSLLHRIMDTEPVSSAGDDRFELHCLLCERDFMMSLWSLKTFYHYSETRPKLIIHDDGTLSDHSKSSYAEHFVGCTIIDRADADREMDRALASYPLCREFRRRKDFYCSLKLFDCFHFCESGHLLHLDADVLFFSKPEELLVHIDNSRPFFMSDYQDAYSFSREDLERVFDVSIQARGNAGLTYIPRQRHFDYLPVMESYFEKLKTTDYAGMVNRHEQTLNIALLSDCGAARLSPAYQISTQPHHAGTVSHHYVDDGSRKRFYIRALPELAKRGFLRC